MEKKSIDIVDESGHRRVPAMLVFAIIMQIATAIWWASAKEREAFFIEQRVKTLEVRASRVGENQNQISERLARIEERLSSQSSLLDRIEKQTRLPR